MVSLGPLPEPRDTRDEDAWLALYCAILGRSPYGGGGSELAASEADMALAELRRRYPLPDPEETPARGPYR